MLTLRRTGKTPQMLRMTVAVLLLFSCARVVRPLASWSVTASPGVGVRCLQITRNVVLEVGAGCVKLVRPSDSRLREVLVAPSLTPSALQALEARLLVSIWPEHRRVFLRRILLSTLDPGH